MKRSLLFSLCLAIPCLGWAAPLINDTSLLDRQWSTTSSFTGIGVGTATGGQAPALSVNPDLGKQVLVLSNVGATAGSTHAQQTVSSMPNEYILTVRSAVIQWNGNGGATANTKTMTIAQLQNHSMLSVGLKYDTSTETTSLLINGRAGGTSIDLASKGITLELGTFYTWQFQVSQVIEGDGSVTIYQRENDSSSWTLVAEDIPILYSSIAPSALATYSHIAYSDVAPQGILHQEYFQLGIAQAIPEPSAALLLLPIGVGAILFRRARRRAA